jgi:hypothetical protein
MSLAQEFRQEGIWIGKIQVLQELMGVKVSEKAELSSHTEMELAELFRRLQIQYNSQFKRSE